MRIKLTIFGVILCLTFLGCANPQMEFKKTLDSWMGHSIDEMIRSWGPPTNTFNQPNGDRVYTWETSSRGAVAMPLYGGVVARENNFWCKKDIYVNPAGKIIWYRADGNNCY